MASQVQIPFEGVILQEHSAPISCPTPNFAKGSREHLLPTDFVDKPESPALAVPIEVVRLLVLTHSAAEGPLEHHAADDGLAGGLGFVGILGMAEASVRLSDAVRECLGLMNAGLPLVRVLDALGEEVLGEQFRKSRIFPDSNRRNDHA